MISYTCAYALCMFPAEVKVFLNRNNMLIKKGQFKPLMISTYRNSNAAQLFYISINQ